MEWTSLLIAQQIPAGPISNLEDVFMDAQVVATGLVETVEHPVLGALKQVGLPVRVSTDPDHRSVRMHPPMLGEHTCEVLGDFGFSAHGQIGRASCREGVCPYV